MNTYERSLHNNGEIKIKPEESTSENISNSEKKEELSPEDIHSENNHDNLS
jgi:hypothetical protein